MTSPPQPPRPLLSLRSFVLIVVALAIGIGAGTLTYLPQRSVPASLLVGVAAFAAALKLLHELVE